MHTCPQVFLLLCETGCLPMDGLVYHTYASALWGLANQAAPVCTHAHGHAHAQVHVCVPYVPPLHLLHTHPICTAALQVYLAFVVPVPARSQCRPRGSDE